MNLLSISNHNLFDFVDDTKVDEFISVLMSWYEEQCSGVEPPYGIPVIHEGSFIEFGYAMELNDLFIECAHMFIGRTNEDWPPYEQWTENHFASSEEEITWDFTILMEYFEDDFETALDYFHMAHVTRTGTIKSIPIIEVW